MDRKEFKSILGNIFSPFGLMTQEKAIEALLTNDVAEIARMKQIILQERGKITGYLNAYDAAPNEEAKQAIMGSVKKS